MANVTKLLSPQGLLDYLNSITLGTTYRGDFWIVDAGARYTVVEDNAGTWKVTTLNSEDELSAYLDTLVADPIDVIPKKEGGFLTYISRTNESAGSNSLVLTIAADEQELVDAYNSIGAVNVQFTVEHNLKFLIFST